MNNTTITATANTTKAKNTNTRTATKAKSSATKRTASPAKRTKAADAGKETEKDLTPVKTALRNNKRGMLGTIPETDERPHNDTIPEGFYQAAITNAKDIFLASGVDIIRIEITITDGEYKGRKMYRDIWDDSNGLDFLFSTFRVCTGKNPPREITKDTLVGISGFIRVQSVFRFWHEDLIKRSEQCAR